MFTLLIIICIVVFIQALKKNSTPDKKNTAVVQQSRSQIPSFTLNGKLDNFSVKTTPAAQVLTSFSFNNNIVTLRSQSGTCISENLNNLTVRFSKLNGVDQVSIGNRMTIWCIAQLYTQKEWDLIYNVLSLAGTTYGAEGYDLSNYNKNMNTIKTLLKGFKYLS